MREAALDIDAPVTLDELIDRNARETLALGARDLGVEVAVIDKAGQVLAGVLPPDEVLRAEAELEPVGVGRFMVAALHHDGGAIGRVVVGPYPEAASPDTARRVASHITRVADAFIVEGIKRALSARMHMATVEESSRELTEKNRRLAQVVERLTETDRVKSNFLATVSHELRTPLTSVIGYSEMLLEGIAGEMNEEQREYVRTVMEKGDQLLQLITGILDISRMEAGAMMYQRSEFAVDEVAAIAVSTIAPHARRKRLAVTCEIGPELPRVYGDRDKTRQVLLNLLGNAVKFTPEGGSIVVSALPAGEAVQVSVADSGIGIPPEHHKRVFDAFFQVDNSSTREFGGTGLGLNIVKRFVEGQGGRVWVESEDGEGAVFVFTLPVAPSRPTP